MPLRLDDILHEQYRILGLLGQGGFGYVYHAHDTLLECDVAIKELIPALVGDDAWVKRFLVEARATFNLHHTNIVTTHTLFAEGGNHYLVMEYMPGGSLQDRLREADTLPVDEVVPIGVGVSRGIGYAHSRGIVHCDLKPANILFAANGTPKVSDFGIAHVSDDSMSRTWATSVGFSAGTVGYMSPEQAEGLRSDPRTDLYALGAILYRLVAGRPYLELDTSGTAMSLARNLMRIQQEAPAVPSSINPEVPAWLDEVILRLLAKKPADRPESAGEALALLLRGGPAAAGQPVRAGVPRATARASNGEETVVRDKPSTASPVPGQAACAPAPVGEETVVRDRQGDASPGTGPLPAAVPPGGWAAVSTPSVSEQPLASASAPPAAEVVTPGPAASEQPLTSGTVPPGEWAAVSAPPPAFAPPGVQPSVAGTAPAAARPGLGRTIANWLAGPAPFRDRGVLAIAALATALVALLVALGRRQSPLGALVAVNGIVAGVLGLKTPRLWVAVAGIVLGAIALVAILT